MFIRSISERDITNQNILFLLFIIIMREREREREREGFNKRIFLIFVDGRIANPYVQLLINLNETFKFYILCLRISMEQRAACLVLMLCLVFGTLVKQSTAKAKMDMKECYNLCAEACFGSSLGNYQGSLSCPSCYTYCYNYVHGQTCFLSWCWKIK